MKNRFFKNGAMGIVGLFALGAAQVAVSADMYNGTVLNEMEGTETIAADVALDKPQPKPEWGTSLFLNKVIPGIALHGLRDAQPGSSAAGVLYHEAGTSNYFDVGFDLPNGAMFYGATTHFYDTNASARVRLLIWELVTSPTATSFSVIHEVGTTNADAGGHYSSGYQELTNTGPIVVDHYEAGTGFQSFSLRAQLTGIGTTLGFRNVALWYQLQVAAPPGTATFLDVPDSHWAFRNIEALAATGITSGCGGGNFCPNNNVTRAQMAVFLAKALGLQRD